MKAHTFSLVLLISTTSLIAQVAVGDIVIDPHAMLDLTATNNKGVLIPRMSTIQRDAIATPANGLIIYNTDTQSLSINEGTAGAPAWENSATQTTKSSKLFQSSKFSNTDVSTNINAAIDLPIFGNEEWNDNTTLYNVLNETSIQINETARYKIIVNASLINSITGARKAPEMHLQVNGSQNGAFASTGYIRITSGHQESSLHLNEILSLSTGDILNVQMGIGGRSGTMNLRSAGSSTFYIEKIN